MSSIPPPLPGSITSRPDDFENLTEIIPPVKWFLDTKKFFRTRSAILAGYPLHNMTKRELATAEYMGPWTFNATQSALSALPAAALAGITWLTTRSSTESSDQFWLIFGSTFTEMIDTLKAGLVPFTLLLTVCFLARASLYKADAIPSRVHCAQRYLLYADGTYGLYPQMAIAFLVGICSLLLSATANDYAPVLVAISVITLFVVSVSYSRRIYGPVALRLFSINGYVTSYRFTRYGKTHLVVPPYANFTLSILALPVATLAILAAAVIVAAGASLVLTILKVSIGS